MRSRVFPPRAASRPQLRNRIISVASPEFSTEQLLFGAAPGNGAWVTANKALAIPFRISEPCTVYQFGWRNGSGTATDSFDIGIYTTAYAKIITGGGTARSGASSVQWVDVADTVLSVGSYYLVGANNGITSNNITWTTAALNAAAMSLCGITDSADDLYPLPDPLTNMGAAATFTRIPSIFMATRVPF